MNIAQKFTLALVLAASLGLRVACNMELLPPLNIYPNEASKVSRGVHAGNPDTEDYTNQPSFLTNSIWLLHFPARLAYWTGKTLLPGHKPFTLELNVFYLWLGRVYMALFGVATVVVVFLLGRALGGAGAGLLAAMALAVAPIHVLNCRYTKEDVPLALFGTLAILLDLGILRRGGRRDYAKAGLLAGLCLSTKWLGIVWWIPLLAAHWRRRAGEKRGALPAGPRRRLAWAALCFALGFCVLSPDMALHPGLPYEGLRRGLSHVTSSGGDDVSIMPLSDALTDYWKQGLWLGMTPSLLAMAGAGWIWLRRRGRADEALLVGGWSVLFFLMVELEPTRAYPNYQRYLLPAIPCIAALSGCGMVALGEWLRRRPGAGRILSPGWSLALAGALALALPLHDAWRYLEAIPDSTIERAGKFMLENIPKDALVFTDQYAPRLGEYGYRTGELRDEDKPAVPVFPPEPCYLVYSSLGVGRYIERLDSDPPMTRFLYYILGHGELVGEWTPKFRTYYMENPTIKLLRFDATEEPYRVPASHLAKKKKPREGKRLLERPAASGPA